MRPTVSLSRTVGGPWTPHWKTTKPTVRNAVSCVTTSPRHSCETIKMILLQLLLYYCSIHCQSKWCMLMCLLSDGTTTQPQANGTHKNQMGQAEGRSTHTHIRTPLPRLLLFLSPFLNLTLFLSLNLLNCEQALQGFPSGLHGNHSACPSCLSCPAPPSLAGNNGCFGDQLRVCLCSSRP